MDTAGLQRLDGHYRAMPPVAAMQARVLDFDGDKLRLRAPLDANVNDKGCAFAGSLCGLMTLAGWGLATLKLDAAGLQADVYIADSEVRYLAPLHADLVAEAWLGEGQCWNEVADTFCERGRARVGLEARVGLPCGEDACRLRGRYALLTRRTAAT